MVASSAVELSSITQGMKEREACGREREMRVRGFESILHREGRVDNRGLEAEGPWFQHHLGSSSEYHWNSIFFQLKNVEIGLDWL